MLLDFIKRQRERAEAIERAADALQAEHGDLAYSIASKRTRVRGLSNSESRHAWAVRRVIASRIGHRIGDENATEKLED